MWEEIDSVRLVRLLRLIVVLDELFTALGTGGFKLNKKNTKKNEEPHSSFTFSKYIPSEFTNQYFRVLIPKNRQKQSLHQAAGEIFDQSGVIFMKSTCLCSVMVYRSH